MSFFIYIYEVSTMGKMYQRATIHYLYAYVYRQTHTHTYISRARVCGPRPYTHTSIASNKTWTVYAYINAYTCIQIST